MVTAAAAGNFPDPAILPFDLAAARSLLDEIVVGRLLGRGGMGVVYSATRKSSGRAVAVKFMLAEGREGFQRFLREVNVLMRLEHPNIVELLAHGFVENTPYLMMELVDGGSLEDLVRMRGGRLPLLESVDVMRQILAGLEYLHSHGTIHRDLKPANVLRSNDGRFKIGDLGLTWSTADASLTSTSQVMGTPAYMPPEQFLGPVRAPSADLYSACVILFRLLTGRLPFQAASYSDYYRLHHGQRKPALAATVLDPTLPAMVDDLIRLGMNPNPRTRLQSVADLREWLDRLVEAASPARPDRRGPDVAVAGRGPAPSVDPLSAATQTRRPRAWIAPVTVIAIGLGAAGLVRYREVRDLLVSADAKLANASLDAGKGTYRSAKKLLDESSMILGDINATRGLEGGWLGVREREQRVAALRSEMDTSIALLGAYAQVLAQALEEERLRTRVKLLVEASRQPALSHLASVLECLEREDFEAATGRVTAAEEVLAVSLPQITRLISADELEALERFKKSARRARRIAGIPTGADWQAAASGAPVSIDGRGLVLVFEADPETARPDDSARDPRFSWEQKTFAEFVLAQRDVPPARRARSRDPRAVVLVVKVPSAPWHRQIRIAAIGSDRDVPLGLRLLPAQGSASSIATTVARWIRDERLVLYGASQIPGPETAYGGQSSASSRTDDDPFPGLMCNGVIKRAGRLWVLIGQRVYAVGDSIVGVPGVRIRELLEDRVTFDWEGGWFSRPTRGGR